VVVKSITFQGINEVPISFLFLQKGVACQLAKPHKHQTLVVATTKSNSSKEICHCCPISKTLFPNPRLFFLVKLSQQKSAELVTNQS
jgi:hypothetical protein